MQFEKRELIDKLILHGQVVTMDENLSLIEDGAVAVNGTKIVAVGPSSELASKYDVGVTIDASGQIVMPGLINAHTHAAGILFRGLVTTGPLFERLETYWRLERKFCRPDTISAGSRLAFAEMMRSGTTTAMDMYFYPEASAEVARQIGFRLLTGPGHMNINNPPDGIPIREVAALAREFMHQYQHDALITPIVKPHSVYTVPPEFLQQAKALADEFGAIFHTHAAESAQESADVYKRYDNTPIDHLEAIGVLDDRTVLAHCVHVSDREIAVLAERKTAAVHCPVNNLRGGSGIAPVPKMLQTGVPILLGTNGAMRSNPLEMWMTMRLAAMIQRGLHQDPGLVPDLEVVKMATCGAARALQLNTGSLEPGKLADIILVDLESPHLIPVVSIQQIYSHLINAVGRENISTVIINGQMVMQDRRMLTLDVRETIREIKSINQQIASYL
jgi:5-methylthioadenosine/S-adenosylhomocysteine deaminase